MEEGDDGWAGGSGGVFVLCMLRVTRRMFVTLRGSMEEFVAERFGRWFPTRTAVHPNPKFAEEHQLMNALVKDLSRGVQLEMAHIQESDLKLVHLSRRDSGNTGPTRIVVVHPVVIVFRVNHHGRENQAMDIVTRDLQLWVGLRQRANQDECTNHRLRSDVAVLDNPIDVACDRDHWLA